MDDRCLNKGCLFNKDNECLCNDVKKGISTCYGKMTKESED